MIALCRNRSQGSEAHIVQMDEYKSFPALKPDGYLLKFRNQDQPGQLAKLLGVLEEHNVNIARLSLGRQEANDLALCLISCDTEVPPAAIAKLEGLGSEDVSCCVV